MINLSVMLCLCAGLFGVYALINWFCILKSDVYTNIHNVLPIIIGTLAWLSAAVTLYQTQTYDSPINIERFFMLVTWVWLIYRIKHYRVIVQKLQKNVRYLKSKME